MYKLQGTLTWFLQRLSDSIIHSRWMNRVMSLDSCYRCATQLIFLLLVENLTFWCLSIAFFFTQNDIVEVISKLSVPRHKVILGLPLFGISYTLKSYSQNKPGDPVLGPGKPSFQTKKTGFLSYGEVKLILSCFLFLSINHLQICYVISNHQPKIKNLSKELMVPYLQYSNQWISYENEESLKRKVGKEQA